MKTRHLQFILNGELKPLGKSLTNSVSFAEVACDHNVHVIILTQVQLQQVDLHLAVFDKHSMFNNLEG